MVLRGRIERRQITKLVTQKRTYPSRVSLLVVT